MPRVKPTPPAATRSARPPGAQVILTYDGRQRRGAHSAPRPLTEYNPHHIAHRWTRQDREVMARDERLLFSAVASNDTRLAAQLLLGGVSPNAVSRGGLRPIHVALLAKTGEPMVAGLLEARADVSARSDALGSAVHTAVRAGDAGALDAILRVCATADLNTEHRGLLPLHSALELGVELGASRASVRILCALLDHGADPEAKVWAGSPLPRWVADLAAESRRRAKRAVELRDVATSLMRQHAEEERVRREHAARVAARQHAMREAQGRLDAKSREERDRRRPATAGGLAQPRGGVLPPQPGARPKSALTGGGGQPARAGAARALSALPAPPALPVTPKSAWAARPAADGRRGSVRRPSTAAMAAMPPPPLPARPATAAPTAITPPSPASPGALQPRRPSAARGMAEPAVPGRRVSIQEVGGRAFVAARAQVVTLEPIEPHALDEGAELSLAPRVA